MAKKKRVKPQLPPLPNAEIRAFIAASERLEDDIARGITSPTELN